MNTLLTTSNVFNSLGIWNWDGFSFVLPNLVHSSIQATPLNPSSRDNDLSVWKSNINGVFNLKAAYAISLRMLSPPSNSNVSFSWIWKIRCHARRKFFFWKVVVNGLPCKALLFSRGIGEDAICPLCGQGDESISHFFRDCSLISLVWNKASSLLDLVPAPDFIQWLKVNATYFSDNTTSIPHGTMFIYLLWHVWVAKNHKIVHSATFSVDSVIHSAFNDAAEWHCLAGPIVNSKDYTICNIKWIPPPLGWWKMNSDGSCCNSVYFCWWPR